MTSNDIIAAWNEQADEYNQWESRSESEKIEFSYDFGFEACRKIIREMNGHETDSGSSNL